MSNITPLEKHKLPHTSFIYLQFSSRNTLLTLFSTVVVLTCPKSVCKIFHKFSKTITWTQLQHFSLMLSRVISHQQHSTKATVTCCAFKPSDHSYCEDTVVILCKTNHSQQFKRNNVNRLKYAEVSDLLGNFEPIHVNLIFHHNRVNILHLFGQNVLFHLSCLIHLHDPLHHISFILIKVCFSFFPLADCILVILASLNCTMQGRIFCGTGDLSHVSHTGSAGRL